MLHWSSQLNRNCEDRVTVVRPTNDSVAYSYCRLLLANARGTFFDFSTECFSGSIRTQPTLKFKPNSDNVQLWYHAHATFHAVAVIENLYLDSFAMHYAVVLAATDRRDIHTYACPRTNGIIMEALVSAEREAAMKVFLKGRCVVRLHGDSYAVSGWVGRWVRVYLHART